MSVYLIIDLPKTRENGAVMFWGVGSTVTTANPRAAMVVNSSYLDQNLERFDNGATTQAVLKSVVDEHNGQLEYLLHLPLRENVA
jgi:hypothetical protein